MEFACYPPPLAAGESVALKTAIFVKAFSNDTFSLWSIHAWLGLSSAYCVE